MILFIEWELWGKLISRCYKLFYTLKTRPTCCIFCLHAKWKLRVSRHISRRCGHGEMFPERVMLASWKQPVLGGELLTSNFITISQAFPCPLLYTTPKQPFCAYIVISRSLFLLFGHSPWFLPLWNPAVFLILLISIWNALWAKVHFETRITSSWFTRPFN